MYALAAEQLLHALHGTDLFVCATACELYGKRVFDLLGQTKVECQLKIDRSGQLQVGPRSPRPVECPQHKLETCDDIRAPSSALIVHECVGSVRSGVGAGHGSFIGVASV